MFSRVFILFFIFLNFSLCLYADEKQLIINKLININNITFNFEQTTNSSKEIGTCILVFDNKLVCNYEDSMQKKIVMNSKTLVVQHKRYNKIYFYPISNSPFAKVFNKNNLIKLIEKSHYQLNDNIELSYYRGNKEKIIIFFKKNSYDLAGWRMVDHLQNIINFSIVIKNINSDIDRKIFKIPSAY